MFNLFEGYLFILTAIALYGGIMVLGFVTPFVMWKIFKKAGEKGWKSIIPIYDMVILNKIVGISPWFALLSQVAFIVAVTSQDGLFQLFDFYSLIFLFFMDIYVNYKLCKSFGKHSSFIIGLILLPYIFYPMLAFGNSSYLGPNRIDEKEKEKEKNTIILILILIIILGLLGSIPIINNYRNKKIKDSLMYAYLSIEGEVQYGQEISLNDLIEPNKLPDNIKLTIFINNQELTNDSTYKFNKLGVYEMYVLVEYSDKFTHNPISMDFTKKIYIKDQEQPFIID